MEKQDIKDFAAVKLLVDTFYDKVRADALLAPIFNAVIQDRWPQHLEKMYTFWQTVLLNEHTYQGNPFLPHASLPIHEAHFERWITLFKETIEANFTGSIANDALWRAEKMAQMFLHKLMYYQNSSAKPFI